MSVTPSQPVNTPVHDPNAPVRSVLFVCTGNVCRSVYAQQALHWLIPSLTVTSVGTFAMEGSRIDPPMARELQARGIPAPTTRARQFEPADLDADLVLVMSLRHRAVLLEERPGAVSRIGLLGAIHSLHARSGPVLTRADVAAWARTPPDASVQVPDPFQRGQEAAAQAAEQISAAVDHLADLISPPDLAEYLDAEPGPGN